MTLIHDSDPNAPAPHLDERLDAGWAQWRSEHIETFERLRTLASNALGVACKLHRFATHEHEREDFEAQRRRLERLRRDLAWLWPDLDRAVETVPEEDEL